MQGNNPKTTWFLVADGARASVMAKGDREGALSPVFDHVFSAPGRAHSQKALTDRAGRAFDSFGIGRHALEPRTDWRTQVRLDFARELAAMLETAALAGRFARLVLIAPPKVLGMIRGMLGKAGRRRLAASIGKEMTHLSPARLAEEIKALS